VKPRGKVLLVVALSDAEERTLDALLEGTKLSTEDDVVRAVCQRVQTALQHALSPARVAT
jgi:hypothetical protein